MKKIFIAIVAMVLLSGAAWGQPSGDMISVGNYDAANLDGKCDELCENRCSFPTKNEACYSACLDRCVNTHPWGDSRYRLEKNEVTGKCRVTEFRDNKWKPAHGRDLFGYSCEQASEHLEEYRQSEREDRAWKPIK